MAKFSFLLFVLFLALFKPSPTMAQSNSAFNNDGSPIDINSDRLTLDQEEDIAIFEGRVIAKQSGSTLKTERLDVIYGEQVNPNTGQSERAAKFLIAKGSVILILPDEHVTGDWGRYDLGPELFTMRGNVVVKRETMTLTGDQLIADMRTGVTRMLSTQNNGVGVNLGASPSGN